MRKLAGAVLPLMFVATIAHAQSASPTKPERFRLSAELEAAPSFAGKSLFDLSRDRSDDSEYSASLKITSPPYVAGQPFFVLFGATWSPQRFQKRVSAADIAAPTSSTYVEIGFGDTYKRISQYADACRMIGRIRKPGEVRPYVKYRFTKNYSDFFGAFKGRTNEATVGLRIQDLRYTGSECGANPDGNARKPAFNYQLRGDVVRSWTGDPAEENITYSARAEILSRPSFQGIKTFARGRIDRTVYSYAIAPATTARRDWRYRLGAGLDLTSIVKKLGNVSLEAEAREEWRRSNDPSRKRDQFQLVATLDWDFD